MSIPSLVNSPRAVALHDPATGAAWNEQMAPDDFAVHCKKLKKTFPGSSAAGADRHRWVAGLVLTVMDWAGGFRLTWPAVVGSRMVDPGAVLLVTEVLVILNARQRTAEAGNKA